MTDFAFALLLFLGASTILCVVFYGMYVNEKWRRMALEDRANRQQSKDAYWQINHFKSEGE